MYAEGRGDNTYYLQRDNFGSQHLFNPQHLPEDFKSYPTEYSSGYVSIETKPHPQAEYDPKVAYYSSSAPTTDYALPASNMRTPVYDHADSSVYIQPYFGGQVTSSEAPPNVIYTADIPLHCPYPTPATSSVLLTPAYNFLSSHSDDTMPTYSPITSTFVGEPHYTTLSSAHTDYDQVESFGDSIWMRLRPSHPAPSAPVRPPYPPSPQSVRFAADPGLSDSGIKLTPHGTGADLMEYYAKLERQSFQTPSQLLDSLLKKDATATMSSARLVSPSPTELQPQREEKEHNETQRQARLRVISESVGFQTTDPDTLTCHEKKRSYIECLENYVAWLREQCALVNIEPGEIERVDAHKGLSTRSVRTLIVHMQKTLREDHEGTLQEERNFLRLREQVLNSEAHQRNHTSVERRIL